MELGTIIGLISGTIFIILAIFITAMFNPAGLIEFGDLPSVMVVIGGTLASALVSVKLSNLFTAFKAAKIVFRPPSLNPAAAIALLVQLAGTARKEGLLALEDSAESMDDAFTKKGIMLIVDGTDPELVKGIMETELSYVEERHSAVSAIYEAMAAYAPSWGMIGTMVGLVLMLGRLDDPSMLGPMMSVALVTTFYGCIVANFICNPIAFKLQQISREEILLKTVLIEGMLSIQAGDNPRIIEEKLKSFLAPAMRTAATAGAVGGGASEEAAE